MRPSCKRMPTKLCMMVEAGADYPGVPALLWSPVVQGLFPFHCPCLLMGRGSTPEPQCQFIYLFISSRLPQSVFSPKPYHGFAASEPSSEQGRGKHLCNILFTWSPTPSSPTVIYWLIVAETSPMVLLLVYSFFLMSILNPMTILKYFYYS